MSDFTIEQDQPQYNPWSPLQAMSQIGQQNTQVTAGQIANQGSLLNLQLQRARLAPVISALQGYQQQMQSQPGGLAPTAGNAPAAASAASPSALGSITATPLPPAGGAAPSGPMASGSPALSGSPDGPASSADTGAQSLPPGPGDLAQGLIGVPLPMLAYAAAAGSSDPSGDIAKLVDTRRQWLYSGAAQANSPQAWNSFVMSAYTNGWASASQANQLLNHFELQPRVLQAMASPDENLKYTEGLSGQGLAVDANGNPVVSPAAVAATGAKAQATAYGTSAGKLPLEGALAAADATGADQGHLTYGPQLTGAEAGAQEGGRAPYEPPVTVTQRNPDGSSSQVQVPLPAWAAANGAPSATAGAARAGDLLNPTQGIPASTYAARVTAAENATGNPAAPNASGPGGTPTSSAVGNGQFIDGTWLQLMKQTRPDLTQGQTDAQILAMRSNPQLSQQMTIAYAAQNAPAIASAGFPVNSATLGMAHRLGAENATTVLNANPNAPLSTILPPSVMAANPDLANLTAGSFVRASIAKYGVVPVQLGQPQGATSQPGAVSNPVAPSQTYQPAVGPQAPAPGAPASPSLSNSTPSNPSGTASAVPPPAPGGTPQGGAAAIPGAIVGTYTPTPQQSAQQANDVEQMGDYRKTLLSTANTAEQNNAIIDQMQIEQQNFKMGRWADIAGDMRSMIDGLYKTADIPEDPNFANMVGSQQAFNKNVGNLIRTAAHEASPRSGVQEMALISKAMPADTMSDQGFRQIGNQIGGINDYAIAKSAASSTFSGTPNAFEQQFSQNVSPAVFIFNRMSSADGQQLARTLGQTPEGRQVLQSLKTQYLYAQQHGLFDAVK